MLNEIEQKHSPIGASSAKRWWNCPGSVALIAALPHGGDDTIYSATGTVAHTIGEKTINYIIKGRTDLEGAIVLLQDECGRSYVEKGFEIDVDEKMTEAVEIYVREIADIVSRYYLPWSAVQPEIKFTLTHIDRQAFGTCDAAIHAPYNRLIIADYKNGSKSVSPLYNQQLMYYALGAYYRLPEVDRENIFEVELVIIQPNSRNAAEPVKRHVVAINELLNFEVDLAAAIKRVRTGSQELKMGEWCDFCKAKPFCPKYRAALGGDTQIDFSHVDTQPVRLPDPKQLTPEQIRIIMDNADDIKSWCKAVIAYGEASASRGLEIPGWKIVETKKNRRWVSEEQTESAFKLEFGEAIYNKKLKSPAQMEKLLKAKRKDELLPYFETPVAGKTLVREADARKAISARADGSEFSVWEEGI